MVAQLEQVIVKMYSDEQRITRNRTDPKSVILPEFLGKVKWIQNELFGRLNCGLDLREWITQVFKMF
jgi:hypothetical protein